MTEATRAAIRWFTETKEGTELARYMTERWYVPGASNPLGAFGVMLRSEIRRNQSALPDVDLDAVDWRAVALELRTHWL